MPTIEERLAALEAVPACECPQCGAARKRIKQEADMERAAALSRLPTDELAAEVAAMKETDLHRLAKLLGNDAAVRLLLDAPEDVRSRIYGKVSQVTRDLAHVERLRRDDALPAYLEVRLAYKHDARMPLLGRKVRLAPVDLDRCVSLGLPCDLVRQDGNVIDGGLLTPQIRNPQGTWYFTAPQWDAILAYDEDFRRAVADNWLEVRALTEDERRGRYLSQMRDGRERGFVTEGQPSAPSWER